MLVFIDESGDPGMMGRGGSSEYFTICAIVFDNHDEANRCDARINDLRVELGFSDRMEFHFNKCSRKIREIFLATVRSYEFKYTAFVLNKKNVNGPGFFNKKSFYKFPIRMACQNLCPNLKDAIIVLDRYGNRIFGKELARYLRREVNAQYDGAIKKVKTDRSHNNNLIQLADMVCGAVARSYRADRPDRYLYRNIIRAKELRVQLWPK